MKAYLIQPPYPYTPADADKTVDFIIAELNNITQADIIVTPEYCNAPAAFSKEGYIPYAQTHTAGLVNAVIAAAKRCKAIVALNHIAEGEGKYYNTTRIYNAQGEVCGDYYKQHLPPSEKDRLGDAYTLDCGNPNVIMANGYKLCCLTCYDSYFEEYIRKMALLRPDLILISSHQRDERPDILEAMHKMMAFNTNAVVLRASVSMGENVKNGGCSMAVGCDGTVLLNAGQKTGSFACEVDPKAKYTRSYCFGGPKIDNVTYVEKGRTPWVYRAAGGAVKPGETATGYPRLCAHRGLNTLLPENSLVGLGAAVAHGAAEVEFDVWFTKDGEIVVSHDEDLSRLSDCTGKIRDLTWAEIEKVDVGKKVSPAFTGLRLNKLEEIFRAFPRQTIINLHVKSDGIEIGEAFDETLFQKIVDLIYQYDIQEHVYFMANPYVQKTALKLAPEIPRCMAAGDEPMKIVENAINCQCSKVQFFKPWFNQEMIDKAHAYGIRCNIFWSDDVQEAQSMLSMGIDTILTNQYLKLHHALNIR